MTDTIDPKVSIIIPVHNTAKYLEKCLDSVIDQSLQEIEIIIVDDGSTDGSSEIIQRYQAKDPRIVVISNSEPSGNPGTPRNQALEIAKGEYIGFVDSDDWADSVLFRFFYSATLESKPDVVLLEGYWEESEDNRNARLVDYSKINLDDKNDLFSKYPGLALWDKLFNRKFIEEHRLRLAETKISVDVPFVILALLLAKNIRYAKGCHYHYRQNVNHSTVHLRKKGNYGYITEVYNITENLMKQHGIYEKYKDIHFYKKINSMLYLLSQIENEQAKSELTFLVKETLTSVDLQHYFNFLVSIGRSDVIKKIYAYQLIPPDSVTIDLTAHDKVYTSHPLTKQVGRIRSLAERIHRFLIKKDNLGNKLKVFLNIIRFSLLMAKKESKKIYTGILKRLFKKDAKIPSYYKPPKYSGIISTRRTPRLVVSLTSFPARINTTHLAISTLLTQNFKPDVVILWLAQSQFPDKEDGLPEKLLDLQKYGLTIGWCEDLKSYKKLIPALEKFPNDVIITTDDDVYYPPTFIEKLFQSYISDKKNIHCFRGRQASIYNNQEITPYRNWGLASGHVEASFLNIFTGVGGVLYPPRSLHPDALNVNLIQKLAPTNDDIWFWAMAVLNDTKIVILENNALYPDYIENTQDSGLWEMYNRFGEIDGQLANILRHYPSIKPKLLL
jgi:glycosyltransferase involved in cell wall biosynthesis